MKKNFFDFLKNYKSINMSSFHTPGHKCNVGDFSDIYNLDFTELPCTDSLYEASGIIKDAEKRLTKLYKTNGSFFSSGGNTLCIQAMFRLIANEGENVICDRLIHRSAVCAAALLGINLVWLNRHINFESRLSERLDVNELNKKLCQKNSFKGIYLTSPSYHGILQDVQLISRKGLKMGIPVIVDNAHGSHLKFLNKDLHPLAHGATMTADSAHKTLPVLTGGAWLHINRKKYVIQAKSAMALFGSTSPSYPTMASMDWAVQWLTENALNEFKKLEEKVLEIKYMAEKKGIYIPNYSISDPTRISLGVFKIGYTGYEVRDILYKYLIEPEMCDENYVVLIPTPFNTDEDWKRLKNFLNNLKIKKETPSNIFKEVPLPEICVSLREAIMSDSICVSVNDSLNRIAAEVVCPCPPGIPVVMPGEKIGSIQQELLIRYGILKINVLK